MVTCPNCQSDKTRRGGNTIWTITLVLIAAALPAILVVKIHGMFVALGMAAILVVAHIVLREHVCVACGHQWNTRA